MKTTLPFRLSTALVSGALVVTTATLAPVSSAAEPKPTTVRVHHPDVEKMASDTLLRVHGRVEGNRSGRLVRLQLKTPNGWIPIGGNTRADNRGRYELTVPSDWYYDGNVRVVAPRTQSHGEGRSKSFPMKVVPAYETVGDPKDWRPWDRRARWNPCQKISWKINTTRAPAQARKMTRQAFAEVHRATGLRFVYRGTTKAVPWRDDGGKERSRADIDVAWATEGQVDELGDGTVGWGGVFWKRGFVNYTGGVSMLHDADMTSEPGPGATWQNLILHELGHVMGLDHADGDNQVMYPQIPSSPGRFQKGDLRGLHHLGADNGCTSSGHGRAMVGTPGFAAGP